MESMAEQLEERQHQELEQEAEEEEEEEASVGSGVLRPSFPMGRVKKIVKLDREIRKVNSEALLLISLSADLFLASFAARSRDAALQRKRRTVKLDHLWSAARGHQATSNFLLDCLPKPSQPPPSAAKAKPSLVDKPLPPGARRIDDFFGKTSSDAPAQPNEVNDGT